MTSRLLQAFEHQCKVNPSASAMVLGSVSMSYGELAGRVQGIRQFIETNLPPSESLIAIFATTEIETYASILAVLSTGRGYVPLNPKSPAARNQSCLEQASIATLLCSSITAGVTELVNAHPGKLRIVETLQSLSRTPLSPIESIDDSTVAYLLFTSGSTGVPKGVAIHHSQLNQFLAAVIDAADFGFHTDDRFLQMFDLTFDLSVMSFAVPLCVGASCHLVPDGGSGFISVSKVLSRGKVTVALMVPSVLTFLERYFEELDLPDLRISMFCGEALPQRLAREWWKCAPNARLLNVYGPTEATIYCSTFEMEVEVTDSEQYRGVVSIGTPIRGTQFRVVNDSLQRLASGEKGELVIIGGQVTDGYWRNDEKTQAAFVTLDDGVRGYRSGDLVFEVDGIYYYGGRIDNQLKVDGYRVEAGEIEHHAREFPGVRDAVVVGTLINGSKTVLQLFAVVDEADESAFLGGCRAFLSERLPSYMVPQRLHALRVFPLNSNGKVDRKALRLSLEQASRS